MKQYTLTDEEKKRSLELFQELDGDLSEATKKLFKDENEKGSTVRGRALRKYWVEKGLSYRTKVKKRVVKHFLNDDEKSFVKQHYCPEMTKLELGQLLWPKDAESKGFSETDKFIALCEYINKEFPSTTNLRDDAAGEKYVPPTIISTAIKRLNKVASRSFEPTKLNVQDKKCVEKLISYLCAPRFMQVINSYITKQNRELFYWRGASRLEVSASRKIRQDRPDDIVWSDPLKYLAYNNIRRLEALFPFEKLF